MDKELERALKLERKRQVDNIETTMGSYESSFKTSEITGILEIKKESTNHSIYNLKGQRLSEYQKGINIINGKKIIVK